MKNRGKNVSGIALSQGNLRARACCCGLRVLGFRALTVPTLVEMLIDTSANSCGRRRGQKTRRKLHRAL